MAKEETNIAHAIMKDAWNYGCILMKNVRGMFPSEDGKRRVKAGLLMDGSSDLIGLTEITITPEMVGAKIGIYTAVEVKTEDGQVAADQKNFLALVRMYGGFACVARSPEEARTVIEIQKSAICRVD